MVGQCLGGGQIQRAHQMVRSGLLLNLAVTGVVVVTGQFLAEPLIRLFDSTSPEVIQIGVLYLRLWCGGNRLVYAAMYTLDSFAIGVGAAHGRGGRSFASGVAAGLFPLHGLSWNLSGPGPFAHPARSGWVHLLQKQSLGKKNAGA